MDWLSHRLFTFVHRNNLVYNTCWEDPRLDRQALRLTGRDEVLAITSAGCSVLDYVLTEPARVFAVDMNPRQNALLELKMSAIRNLEFEDFFAMFGEGRLVRARPIYADRLRKDLSSDAREYWDQWIDFFDNERTPFYFRGTAGALARALRVYVDRIVQVRPYVDQLLEATSVGEQRRIYLQHIRDRFWSRPMRFAMGRDSTLSMMGVPRAQRRQVESYYSGGIASFIQECMDTVFGRLPLRDNYFWRVYMTGRYTPGCCPEYLKPESYERLRAGLLDRVSVHTDSVCGFLQRHRGKLTRFVLLDHMDWLSDRFYPALRAEWQAIVDHAAEGARLIWRSGGLRTDYVDGIRVRHRGNEVTVGSLLTYDRRLADELHGVDRVHTYGSFYIADLAA